MTTTEIKKAIEEGIKGQGNQVDLGGKLADILLELSGANPLEVKFESFEEDTKAQAATALGITEEQVDALFKGEYAYIHSNNLLMTRMVSSTGAYSGYGALYGAMGTEQVGGYVELYYHESQGYSCYTGEL